MVLDPRNKWKIERERRSDEEDYHIIREYERFERERKREKNLKIYIFEIFLCFHHLVYILIYGCCVCFYYQYINCDFVCLCCILLVGCHLIHSFIWVDWFIFLVFFWAFKKKLKIYIYSVCSHVITFLR